MADPTPSVSIIIPAYNCEEFLAEAVASVAIQSPPVAEIIIIDDGSTDNTPAIARAAHPLVRCVRQANRGPAAARNVGIKMAGGEIIGFLDADDLWCEGQVARQLERLVADPSAGVVKGMTLFTRKTDNPDGPSRYETFGEPVLYANLCGALYRREVFERAGLLNEELRFGEDVDWTMRARERGIITRVYDQVTQYHRRHSGNMTRGRNFKELNGFEVIRLVLSRRRQERKSGDERNFEAVSEKVGEPTEGSE